MNSDIVDKNNFFLKVISRYYCPVVITDSSSSGNFNVAIQCVKKVFRHFTFYTIDLLVSLFFPEARILSRMPLEVFYARKGKFQNHPLINFMVKWDIPDISSTYSALTILKSFKDITPTIDLTYTSRLVMRALMKSYSHSDGAFVDYVTKLPDFRTTYYAVCAIRQLETLTNTPKVTLFQEIGVNQEQLCDFLLSQGKNSKHLYNWEIISPNFSILEKALSSISFINKEIYKKSFDSSLLQMHDYVIENNIGKITGFKLFSDDKYPSVSANKSGIMILKESSNIESSLTLRGENLEINSIFDTTFQSLKSYRLQNIYSNLFNIYRKLPHYTDSCKVEFPAFCSMYSAGVKSPSASCGRCSL